MPFEKTFVRFVVAGSFLGTTACTTLGPDFETPEAQLADKWLEQAEYTRTTSQGVEQWWSFFDDPVLDQLVETAYRQNLPLQIAGLRILEARAQLGIAIGQQYPQSQQVNGSLTKVGLSENSPNFSPLAETDYVQAGIGFDAAWELDFWGRYRRGVESASANLGASIADYDNALVSLASEVARVYVTIRIFEERLSIARNNAEIQRRSHRIADVRYQNGAVSELDPAQALSLLRQTESTIPATESRIRQNKHALSILLGMAPGDLQGILQGEGSIPQLEPGLNIGVPAELLRRRPDIRRAELEAAAQSARIGIAKSELYPRIALFGSIGLLSSDTGSSSTGDLFESDSVAYNYGPSVSWSILNYGRLKNQVRVQDARLEELLVNYQNTVLEAAREVEDGISAYIGAQNQAAYLKDSVQSAQRAVDLALIQYREGAVDYQRVLDTQQTLVSVEDLYTAARGEEVLSLVATYKALGGGWEVRVGNAFVPEAVQEKMGERTDWGRLLDAEQVPAELPPAPPSGMAQPLINAPDW